jgi:hypothetical protein
VSPLQSELGRLFCDLLHLTVSRPFAASMTGVN